MVGRSRVVFIIPFVGFIIGYFMTYWFMQKTAIPTPNIIGKSLQESVSVLSKNCLGVRLLREQEDAVLPEGTVLDQIPRPYQRVRPNQNIFVTVSKKEGQVQVPDFWGQKHEEMLETAKKRGITIRAFFIPNTFAKNCCVAQYPQVNQLFTQKKLLAYFSMGPESLYVMPSLKGCIVKDIRDFFEQHNVAFEVFHDKTMAPDHECLSCKIVEQRPTAGSIIDLQRKFVVQLQVVEDR